MKNKTAHVTARPIDKKAVPAREAEPQNLVPFVLKYPVLLLMLVAGIVYARTAFFGFTELDDTIFIKEFHEYNENMANLVTSFQRGLFDAVKDPYYRPLFLDSIIINYRLCEQNIFGYHVVNILLHMAATALLFQVFIRLNMRKLSAFIIALFFAVHPVLCQAVSWIPGRNDTLLAVFTFSCLYKSIDYSNFGKPRDLVFSLLFLLLAFFTKETAVFIPVVAFVILVYLLRSPWNYRNNIIQFGGWALCFAIWFLVRSQSPNIKNASPAAGTMFIDFIHRLPLIIQYIGKIVLPVNQSVFPMQEDTSLWFGLAAIVILGLLLYASKDVNRRMVIAGFAIFLLFLIPALLVPNNLNEQTFEHRLYLPMAGMLMVFSETALFKRLLDSGTLVYSSIICAILAFTNIVYQQYFKDPISFWTQAVETSPHSAYAKMMLGAREDNLAHSAQLFREAYRLDPKQKYINYYMGMLLQRQDSVLQSEPYLLREKKISDFYECDFYLARVAMTKADTTMAILYMESYVKRNPGSEPANNNLLLMYINKHMYNEARTQMAKMQQMGLKVAPEFVRMLGAQPQVAPAPPAIGR